MDLVQQVSNMDVKKIEQRIKWLEAELSASNHFDGYVANGLRNELTKLKTVLKWHATGLLNGLSGHSQSDISKLMESRASQKIDE